MNCSTKILDLQEDIAINIDSPISPSDPLLRRALFEVHQGVCFYTKIKISFEEMHVEHIYPRALGGKDTIANYFPACRSINILKSAKYCQQATNGLLHINRLLHAPRVLQKYLELKNASGNVLPKKTSKKAKPKLIEEMQGGEYGLISIELLKRFLGTFSERHPNNIKVIPNDKIIVFYDSISDSGDVERDLINSSSWLILSGSLENQDHIKWTVENDHDFIGYTRKNISWYKMKPYIERDQIELTFYIADMSYETLGFKKWAGIDVTGEDIADAEAKRRVHQRKVHELLTQIPL